MKELPSSNKELKLADNAQNEVGLRLVVESMLVEVEMVRGHRLLCGNESTGNVEIVSEIKSTQA